MGDEIRSRAGIIGLILDVMSILPFVLRVIIFSGRGVIALRSVRVTNFVLPLNVSWLPAVSRFNAHVLLLLCAHVSQHIMTWFENLCPGSDLVKTEQLWPVPV